VSCQAAFEWRRLRLGGGDYRRVFLMQTKLANVAALAAFAYLIIVLAIPLLRL